MQIKPRKSPLPVSQSQGLRVKSFWGNSLKIIHTISATLAQHHQTDDLEAFFVTVVSGVPPGETIYVKLVPSPSKNFSDGDDSFRRQKLLHPPTAPRQRV